MAENPHFETAGTWADARARLAFSPVIPGDTVGFRLQSLRIHVRDHRMRELAVEDRTLEAHYGAFSFSQARLGKAEALRRVREVSFGGAGREARMAGHECRVYELGPEVPADDVDGRSPAVVVWGVGDVFHLVASTVLEAAVLERIGRSCVR